jgi:hypothetical protein
MNSNLAIKRALDELEYAIADLQFDLAGRNLERVLLELRYIADQPRVPAGNPDGGQWTSEDGLPSTGRLPAGTQRVAQAMDRQQFSGVLIRQITSERKTFPNAPITTAGLIIASS